jgi:hypothetical protein
MSEQNMRGRIVRALKELDAVAVENPALPGTPDINYVEGWVELKWLREWPANAESIVRFEHFTPQQRVWHIRRRLAGGVSWVLVQCGSEWLLFDGAVAAQYLNQCSRDGLLKVAARYWDKWSQEELVECISQKQNAFSLSAKERDRLKTQLRSGMALPPVDSVSGKGDI